MKKVAVRRINEWDGPAVLKIYAPYTGTFAAQEPEPPALQEFIQRIDRYTYGLGWILCEIDSDPAGFCVLTEDRRAPEDLFRVEIQLYVKPQYQRRGVGLALWALIRDMMELGSRRRVTARVDPRNQQALAFFRERGFVPAGEADGLRLLEYALAPADPDAAKPVKPYLLENLDYERARERAALLVRPD